MPKVIIKIRKLSKKFIAIVCMFMLVFSFSVITKTDAADTTSRKDTLSDSRPSTVSNHTIAFTLTATNAVDEGDTLTLTFDSAFDTSTIIEDDVDITDDGVDLTTAANCAGAEKASVAMSADVLTITICAGDGGAIAVSSAVVVEIGTNATASGTGANRITNPALLGCSGSSSVCGVTIGGTFGDSGDIMVAILTAVSVSATVDEYLTFSINDTAVGFGTWTGGSTVERFATSDAAGATSAPAGATDPFQLTISTNGGGTTTITVRSVGNGTGAEGNGSAGLYKSTGTTKLIAAAASSAVAGGTEGYGIYASAASGLTIDEGFDDDTTTDLAVSTTNQTFATASGGLSSSTINGELNAAIAATTPAGSYADTIIFVATPTY